MSDILKLDIYFTTKLERSDLYIGMQKNARESDETSPP